MQEETERMVTAVAQDVSKGLVSYDRARRQLVEWGRAGRTIDVGEAIEWLDRNVKKFGYEDAEVDGVIAPVDHSHYYDEPKAANREIMAEAKSHPMIARTNISTDKLAEANARVIDVTARVKQLTATADDEMGVIDGVIESVEETVIDE